MKPAGITPSADRLRTGVALCTYNGSRFVEEQLGSILAQTRSVDCIVVADDGSSDDTVARVRDRLRTAPVASRILEAGHLGITQNFARAVDACEAEVVFLCDQDDVWLPTKVERLAGIFEADPKALLAFSDARLTDADLRDLGRGQFEMVRMTARLQRVLEGPDSFSQLLRRNVVTGATVAFRRRLLDSALPFVDGWLHDEWLAILAAAQEGLRCVPEPLVLYRQHGGNQCGMRPEGLAAQLVQASHQRPTSTGVKRLDVLHTRLREAVPASTLKQLALVETVRGFAAWQARLPHARWRRLLPIVGQFGIGAYHRHADGLRSAVKDALVIRK